MGAAILAAILFDEINLIIKWSLVIDVCCLYLLLNLIKNLSLIHFSNVFLEITPCI